MDHDSDGDTSCNWCTWNCRQRFGKGSGKVENQRKNTAAFTGIWMTPSLQNFSQYSSQSYRWPRIILSTLTTIAIIDTFILHRLFSSPARSKYLSVFLLLVQSAGVAEYTDCFSAEGKTSSTSVLDMTLNNLIVRLQ